MALNILFGAESGGLAVAAGQEEAEGTENAAKGSAEDAGYTVEEEGAAVGAHKADALSLGARALGTTEVKDWRKGLVDTAPQVP